ncbi:hypothetical protein F5Y03DRAFT_397228 [Xylaria venustula]|nr:hypothetical protein F5Y03DRAFT_397228 [Xylaria venustula]
MKLRKVLALVTFTTLTTAWKNTAAFEYAEFGCDGQLTHASVKNTTQSVYTSTANDGIFRWYGFSGATEDGSGCYGDLVGRLHAPCFDLNSFVPEGKPKVECIRLCSLLASKKHSYSCAAFGITDKVGS